MQVLVEKLSQQTWLMTQAKADQSNLAMFVMCIHANV